MVRQTKQTESHRKKSASAEDRPAKKKTAESGVWPCKINGCNKLFAREADLKRHQRTTKLHSVPGFACPQCDATFTRTDALRRHQKSRHNGIIIEPAVSEKGRENGDPQSSAFKSRSRSRSPLSNDKENPRTHAHASTPPSSLPPGGPQSYYRHHTLPGVLMSPGMLADGQYPPGIGLPTSAARLHQANWPHSQPPWADNSTPSMISMGYPHPTAYYASSYYRPSIMPPPPPHPVLVAHPRNSRHQHAPNGATSPHAAESSSSSRGSPPVASSGVGISEDAGSPTTAPVIDPSLDIACSTRSKDAKGPSSPTLPSLGIATATPAVSAESESVSAEREPPVGSCYASGGPLETALPSQVLEERLDGIVEDDGRKAEETIANTETVDGASTDLAYPPPTPVSDPPREMEQILTEDGEPMLNPAELLTQESLASPPP